MRAEHLSSRAGLAVGTVSTVAHLALSAAVATWCWTIRSELSAVLRSARGPGVLALERTAPAAAAPTRPGEPPVAVLHRV